jgi:hypothetical protein
MVEFVPGKLKAFEYAEPSACETPLMRTNTMIQAPSTHQRCRTEKRARDFKGSSWGEMGERCVTVRTSSESQV